MAKKEQIPGRLDEIVANARKARELEDQAEEILAGAGEEENEGFEEENEDSRELSSEKVVIGNEGEEEENPNEHEGGEDEGVEDAGEEEGGEPEPEQDLVTIVVDGEQRQVSRDKVYEQGIRTLQKEAAADKRLAEANQRIKEAQEYEARTRANVEAQLRAAQKQSQDAPLSEQQDADIKQRARRIVDKLLDGDEEEATNALADILGRQQATPVDTNQLVNQVSAQVQRTAELKAAVSDFRKEYPKIAGDKFLWDRADIESDKVQSEHPDWSPSEILLEAGRRVEDWVKSLAGPADQDSTTQRREGKRDKKRTTETLRQASIRSEKPAAPRPPTRSEVVAKMRKSRGLH